MAPELEPATIEWLEEAAGFEGYEAILEDIVGKDFGDEELNQLIYDAFNQWATLDHYLWSISLRVQELKKNRSVVV